MANPGPTESSNNAAMVDRVAVKLPPFWSRNPELWFCQLESQFQLTRVTIGDLLRNPPAGDMFPAIKDRLIALFSESEEQKYKKLVSHTTLGGKKPSHLLNEMAGLGGTLVSKRLPKSMWLQQLPNQIQSILAGSNDSLEQLATRADQIAEILQPGVYQIQQQPETPNFSSQPYLKACVGLLWRRRPPGAYCLAISMSKTSSHVANVGQPDRHASSSPAPTSNKISTYRLAIKDDLTGIRFLIDSGAEVSIVPRSNRDSVLIPGSIYSQQIIHRYLHTNFIIAKTDIAIIGADFLHHFNVLVDMGRSRIIDGTTQVVRYGQVKLANTYSVCIISASCKYGEILRQFSNLTKFIFTPSDLKHNTSHVIHTNGPHVCSKARWLPPKKLKLAKQEFQYLLEMGICLPSKSPWASPLHMVPKKATGEWRLVGDYRRLNSATIEDKYKVPNLHDFSHFFRREDHLHNTAPRYQVSQQSSTPLQEKVATIVEYPLPKTVSDLWRFLGMINFYGKCIPKAAHNQRVLHELHKNGKKNNKTPINWTEETQTAFEQCKKDIANAAILVHPSSSASISLTVGASDFAMGAVIEQFEDNLWKPLEHISGKRNVVADALSRIGSIDASQLVDYEALSRHQTDNTELQAMLRDPQGTALNLKQCNVSGTDATVYCDDNNYSCWEEAYPMADMAADTVAKTFYDNWICRYGTPLKMITDQGRQFESSLFSVLSILLGSKRAHTTPYHPIANGKVER
ncbi:uncharacterized protein [Euwallacea similis]|uniref:uncharacterized protein n=1 Tax=Euwallacea similis TaxID=1736056 RepID=UPI00344F9E13